MVEDQLNITIKKIMASIKKRILVTGSNGQLGREIQKLAPSHPEYSFLFHDVDTLDITNASQVDRFVSDKELSWIINCAAYTAVDKAEEDRANAEKVNIKAVANLADASVKNNARLIHISTDYVFSGTGYMPYKEDFPAGPRSVYGITKEAGEKKALKVPGAFVIRTSWLYSAHGNNFVKTMLRLGSERDKINVVADQIGSPTFAGDLATAILAVIEFCDKNQQKDVSGIYHFSNEGVASWYDFAFEIMQQAGYTCKISPVDSSEFPVPAPRPHYSVLNKEKFRKNFGFDIPHWKISLKKCMTEILASQT